MSGWTEEDIEKVLALAEADFQRTLIEYLEWNGWKVHAERPARTKDGWVTPIQGDKGFPDVIAVKGKRVLAIELKSEKAKYLTTAQWDWLEAFGKAGVEVYAWRPSDWENIVKCLA